MILSVAEALNPNKPNQTAVCGVLQGSIISSWGYFVILAYINDTFGVPREVECILYADRTVLFREAHCLSKSTSETQLASLKKCLLLLRLLRPIYIRNKRSYCSSFSVGWLLKF